jgi:hypothetical protein
MASPITSRSKMTAAQFAAALKANGFRVVNARIEDATGQCPGIKWMALRAGRTAIDYDRTLAKIIHERDAEIARAAGVMLGVDRAERLTQTIRRAGWEARMKRADARAGDLAPIITELKARGVTSLRAIAAALNERGISTPRGTGGWGGEQIRQLLARLKSRTRLLGQ